MVTACLIRLRIDLTLSLSFHQGPPGLPGLKGDTGVKGEKVRLILISGEMLDGLDIDINTVVNEHRDCKQNTVC